MEDRISEDTQEKESSENAQLAKVLKAKFVCCLQAAADKKAEDLVALDLKGLSSFADYFIICHGQSNRQVRGITGHIRETMSAAGYKPVGVEGLAEETWVLLDYGALIVHVFLKDVREFYDLERLWADAPRISVDELLEE